MNKQAAEKIIRDTFESPFDKGRFVHCCRDKEMHCAAIRLFTVPELE